MQAHSPSSGSRILVALGLGLLFAISLGAIAFVVWGITDFVAMGTLPENMGLGLGYIQMGLIPLAGIGGAIIGAVLGILPRPRAIKRWLIGLALVVILPTLVNGALALVLR
jgi:hypothetical protein